MPTRSEVRPDYYEEKAASADARAKQSKSPDHAESWRHVAKTYRWISYHRKAIGKWQPPTSVEC